MKLTRKQIKSNRLWQHWLYWLGDAVPFGSDMKPLQGYQPEQWRSSFEHFQSHGASKLSSEAVIHIAPLIACQKSKEIFLTSLVNESLEFWAHGWGWEVPFRHTLDCNKTEQRRMDRLTKVAILRIMRSLRADPLDFFMRHPGIKPKTLSYYLNLKYQ